MCAIIVGPNISNVGGVRVQQKIYSGDILQQEHLKRNKNIYGPRLQEAQLDHAINNVFDCYQLATKAVIS